MTQSSLNWDDTIHNQLISQQRSYNFSLETIVVEHLMKSPNAHQQKAFDTIWHSITYKEGKIFFLNGF